MLRRLAMPIVSTVAWTIFLMVSGLNIVVGVAAQLMTWPLDRDFRTCLWVNQRIWGRLLFLLEWSFPIRRRGLEHIGPGPYVMVCNHSSVLDIPSCLGLPLLQRVVGKTSLFRVPFMGWYMSFCRQIPLDASSEASVRLFMDRCNEALDAGISILIFPEGTRSIDATLQRFHRGAFRLAKDTGTPVLPVAVLGTHKIMRKGKLPLDGIRTRIQLMVTPPLDPTQHSTARRLSNRAHEAIAAALAQLRQEQGP
jgi:1-acyl-sn-glycerol-3-phosphate acyltransferase